MSFLDRLERRAGWLAFPGLLRYYALLHVLVFALQWVRPDIGDLLAFDRQKIFAGEIWRVATMFFAIPEFGGPSPVAILFLLFAIRFIFMVGDGLEEEWGAFRTSIFCYTGILTVLITNFIYSVQVPMSGTALYTSAFLAFCTIFPRVEILLFFVIPVQVRFLGILTAAGLLLGALGQPFLLPFYLAAYLNYFLWAGLPALRGSARVIESAHRRHRFQSRKLPADDAFHTCIVCGRTDRSDPALDFRIGGDGREYCTEHLPG